jgi:hypothetical protein
VAGVIVRGFAYPRRARPPQQAPSTANLSCAFEDDRLPELYCGFDHSVGPPVPNELDIDIVEGEPSTPLWSQLRTQRGAPPE